MPLQPRSGAGRDGPHSADRIQLVDLDELLGEVCHKKAESARLEQELLQLQQQETECLALLSCTDPLELAIFVMEQEQTAVCSQDHCASVVHWTQAENRVTVYKLLGTELMRLTVDTILFHINCHEDNYPHLPQKILKIEQIPNTNFLKMTPKEISFYMDCSVDLKNMMVRSTKEEMIQCFRMTQDNILDLVDRDNIYQHLAIEKLVSDSISCTKSRKTISFNIPKVQNPITLPGDKYAGFYTVPSILANNICLTLTNNVTTASGWDVQIYSHGDPDCMQLPSLFEEIMKEFMENLSEQPLVETVKLMLQKVDCMMQPSSIDGSSRSSSPTTDELAALF